MSDLSYLQNFRRPTTENPLQLLVSACLLGVKCGADGSTYGDYPQIRKLSDFENVKITLFCPEEYVFGTPREIPDLSEGNGADFLEGKARLISESGKDLSKEILKAGEKMVQIAKENQIELAILMDISAACGSQVIYLGSRKANNPLYQKGRGVCAEMLHRNGINIISQRDFRSLEILFSKIDPHHQINSEAIDHDETEWYKNYFKSVKSSAQTSSELAK